ncbi:biosynthetic peptidoglycan transglycosylase [Cytophagales bacterium LB-30]|uniref:Biosynthetic peptidoglycan transglycosylase n=1 Tax=Shiella aurantiaca TaxID=3058365 RepID=A0ABT8F4I8_9BACT|nr:biosynthetic peptidoglycan transglycosylase [Shiella aurantiaca]MDN4165361.1 biosynthetic peptidoglycan transglycosylase [Shiella aurantiaca]
MKTKQIPRWLRLGLLTFLGTCLLGYLAFRFILLEPMLFYVLEKYENRYNIRIAMQSAEYRGANTFQINQLAFIPPKGDTLFRVDTLVMDVKILPLFVGKIRFSQLITHGLKVAFHQTDSSDNYSFLLRKNQVAPTEFKTATSYRQVASRMLGLFFELIPDKAQLQNSELFLLSPSIEQRILMPHFQLKEEEWKATLQDAAATTTWSLSGRIASDLWLVSLEAIPEHPERNIPLLKNVFELGLAFDTLQIAIQPMDMEEDQLPLQGEIKVKGFSIEHWRIAPHPIVVPEGSFTWDMFIGDREIKLDSSSMAKIGGIQMHHFVYYTAFSSGKALGLQLRIPEMPFSDFLSSLPQGLFPSLEGMKAEGELRYSLQAHIPFQYLDSLRFDSDLDIKKANIQRFGQEVLTKINAPFGYRAYQSDRYMRSLWIGDSNRYFTPLDSISPWLIEAIQIAEDGRFMTHHGFHEEAFRQSIIQNLKEKRFARGGSTITMQLVKNVFLSQNKNITRKVEEAFLVWLIENYRLVSKERLLEVYLNCIEWGPNVYGIGEAAEFYFQKKPSALNKEEAIFLAMIVPRPRQFMYYFDKQAKLKSFTQDFYELELRMMGKRQFPLLDSLIQVDTFRIELPGSARQFLIQPTMVDSTQAVESAIELLELI